jgi:hypothetical protein
MLDDDEEYDDEEYDDEEYDDDEEGDDEDDDEYDDGPSKKPLIIVAVLGLAALVCIGLAVLLLNGDKKDGDGTAGDPTPVVDGPETDGEELDPLAGLDLGGADILDGLDLGLDIEPTDTGTTDSKGTNGTTASDSGTKSVSGTNSTTTSNTTASNSDSNTARSDSNSDSGRSDSNSDSGRDDSRSDSGRNDSNSSDEPAATPTPEATPEPTPEPTPEEVEEDPTPEEVAEEDPTPEEVAEEDPTPEEVAEEDPTPEAAAEEDPTPEEVAEADPTPEPTPEEPAVPMSYDREYLASIAGKANSGGLSAGELNHLKAAPTNDPNYLTSMAIGMAHFEAKRDYKAHCEWSKTVTDQGRYKYKPEFQLELAKCHLRNGRFDDAIKSAETTISYQTDMGSAKRGLRVTLAYQIKAKSRTALYETDAKKNAGFGNEQMLNKAVAAWTEVRNYAKGVGLSKVIEQANREIEDLDQRRAPTD